MFQILKTENTVVANVPTLANAPYSSHTQKKRTATCQSHGLLSLAVWDHQWGQNPAPA
jgi:hypothetical protein